LAFLPIIQNRDRTIKVWDINTGTCLKTLRGHTDWVWSVIFTHDNHTLISGSDDHTIKLWDIQTGNCIQVLTDHENRIWSVDYSPKLNMLFSCSEDETIKLWDIHALKCIKTLKIPKPYEGMSIKCVSGLTEAALKTLRVLGSVTVTA
jgi:WD40 repeat protein